MAVFSYRSPNAFRPVDEPLSTINITPLIDVMLVLLIMLILTIPLATHQIEIDLPGPPAPDSAAPTYDTVALAVQEDGAILWNGEPVSRQQLDTRLAAAAALPEMPLIRFEPDANASYDDSVRVINAIADAQLDKFAFSGNHKYREFGSD